jgi:acetyl-CoA synthetase
MGNDDGKKFNSLMTETRSFPPPPEITAQAHIKSMAQYEAMWKQSIEDPDTF